MAEEEQDKKEEEKKEEPFNEPTEEKTVGLVDEANRVTDRFKRETDRREQLVIREEKLEVARKLGGRSEAGAIPVKKEETDVEYAERVMRGDI